MADILTEINLPGIDGSGIANWGERSPAEMVAYIRSHFQREKGIAEMVLAAADEDFRIGVVKGVHARRRVRLLQDGRLPQKPQEHPNF